MSTPPPAWHSDPTGRFEQRYWDGSTWTEHVWISGQQLIDPLGLINAAAAGHSSVASSPPDPHELRDDATHGDGEGLSPSPPTHSPLPEFPAGWSQKKRSQKSAEAAHFLLPGEVVLYQGRGGTWTPITNDLVITDTRIFSYGPAGVGLNLDIRAVVTVKPSAANGRVTITDAHGSLIKVTSIPGKELGPVQDAIMRARSSAPTVETRQALEESIRKATEAQRVARLTIHERWTSATILGTVSKKSGDAILRLCHADETPWLVLAPGAGQGVLAAFDDRLAIIKIGALTSFMAGSLGGERTTTFYFVDINAIEYNSGFANGVLEVLTASYQGTANKDFWRGTAQSRNADSNDPYTLSNALPMAKAVYQQWAPQIQELRSKIAESKRPAVNVVSSPAPAVSDLVSQLEKLVALRAAGALTDEEFAAAKARLVSE